MKREARDLTLTSRATNLLLSSALAFAGCVGLSKGSSGHTNTKDLQHILDAGVVPEIATTTAPPALRFLPEPGLYEGYWEDADGGTLIEVRNTESEYEREFVTGGRVISTWRLDSIGIMETVSNTLLLPAAPFLGEYWPISATYERCYGERAIQTISESELTVAEYTVCQGTGPQAPLSVTTWRVGLGWVKKDHGFRRGHRKRIERDTADAGN